MKNVAFTLAAIGFVISGTFTFAEQAILPQGDPKAKQERQERAHDERLKQKGQGENYRRLSAGGQKPREGLVPLCFVRLDRKGQHELHDASC